MSTQKKKLFKWVLLLVFITVLTGGFVGYKMYNKPHRDVLHARGIHVPAAKLVTDYETNEEAANSAYLDKVLEVTGIITEVSKNQKGETVVVLDGTGIGTVRCTMEGSVQHDMKTGASVIIKGICTGYLTDVIIVRGSYQDK